LVRLTVEAKPPPFNSLRLLLSNPSASPFPWMKLLALLQPLQYHLLNPLVEYVFLGRCGPPLVPLVLHPKSWCE